MPRSDVEDSYASVSGSYASSSEGSGGGSLCRNICCFLLIMLLLGGTAALIYKVVEGSHDGGDDDKSNDNVNTLSGGREGPVKAFNFCGSKKRKAVLTFDDGPSVEATPNVLKDLRTSGIKATFFLSPAVDGEPSGGQCDLVRMILKDGHSVQSHSWDHVSFLNLTDWEVKENLKKNRAWIEKCAGDQSSKLSLTQFRPPYGNLDYVRAQFISNELDYTIATWNIETQDHLGGDKETIMAEIDSKYHELVPNAEESVVVLMHDKKYVKGGTIGAIPLIHRYFDNLGYDFINTEECYEKCDDYVSFCRMNNVWPGTYETP